MERCFEALSAGKLIRALELDPEQWRYVRSLGMITASKVLYVANVDDRDVHGQGPLAAKVRAHAAAEGSGVIAEILVEIKRVGRNGHDTQFSRQIFAKITAVRRPPGREAGEDEETARRPDRFQLTLRERVDQKVPACLIFVGQLAEIGARKAKTGRDGKLQGSG